MTNSFTKILNEIKSDMPNQGLIAQEIVKDGFNVNEIEKLSLLEYAVIYEQVNICYLLVETKKINKEILKLGLELALKDYLDNSEDKYAMCKLLLEAGAEPANNVLPEIIFPIIDKNFEEGMKILELLLIHHADVDTFEEEHGYNLLSMTAQLHTTQGKENLPNRIKLFQLLMQYRVNPELSNEGGALTPLMNTAEEGSFALTKLLLDYGADITMEDRAGTSVFSFGDLKMRDFLINELHCLYGKEIVELSLKKDNFNTDVIKKNKKNEALELAIQRSDSEKKINNLLATGANPNYKNSNGNPMIYYLSLFGKNVLLAQLLAAGGDVNCRDNSSGNTPLHIARNLETAQLLISFKANVQLKNSLGETVLHTVIKDDKSEDLIRFFLDQNVDPNEVNYRGQTALHKACIVESDAKIIQLLIEYKVNIDAQDIYGKTALHRAVQKSSWRMINILLENGANPCIKCLLGKTPIDYTYSADSIKKALLTATEDYQKKNKKNSHNVVKDDNCFAEKRVKTEDKEIKSNLSYMFSVPSSSNEDELNNDKATLAFK